MDDNKKSGGAINKLVMGIIIGGAIGSVVGLTFAPRKGKETREILKKRGQEVLEKGREAGERFMRDHHETIESAKYQIKKGGGGFLKWAARLLLKKKGKTGPMPKVEMESERRGK